MTIEEAIKLIWKPDMKCECAACKRVLEAYRVVIYSARQWAAIHGDEREYL